jgi:5-methylcytosine-specific restriction protein A
MIPHNITREHILQAILHIDKYGVPDNRKSKKFALLFEGKQYPPKYVVALANIGAI